MSSLSQFLPEPKHRASSSSKSNNSISNQSTALARTGIPPLGQRKGWMPKTEADFGDGGAYPEIHVLQYPRGMGRKKSKRGNALAKQVDAEGNVDYEALARHGRRDNEVVQSSFRELIPLRQRADFNDDGERAAIPERPDAEAVRAAAEKTKLALEKIVGGRISAAGAKGAASKANEPTYVRYTPNQQAPGFNSGAAQRIVRISDMPVDPMAPPKIKLQKPTRRPASPPAPVMHSPPRKLTAEEQKEWVIPPCVSNWKNIHGFTVSLDKRLAADGRGAEQIEVGDNFARLSEALVSAEAHARKEIAERAQIQQTLAQREKDAKEERLRALAQRAREERAAAREIRVDGAVANADGADDAGSSSGSPTPHVAAPASATLQMRADRGRKTARDFFDSPSDNKNNNDNSDNSDNDDDSDAVRQRDALRRERRKQHERELRVGRNGGDDRQQRRAEARDISEKIALGIAKPTAARETMFDSRLFNQPSASNAQMQNEEAYNLYDKPLFATAGRSANYRPRAAADDDDDGAAAGDVARMMDSDRFGATSNLHGLAPSSSKKRKTEQRAAPVEFEKGDVFGIDDFVGSTRSAADQAGKK
ncbi:mRNA splicing protein [Coemansia sp. RSA 2599]|nr:mRNA splicing protein [Coemansia sp. RSA 2598]KAJ1829330.1 mRNA splicing protein [Coemansia sp. RSA 2599]